MDTKLVFAFFCIFILGLEAAQSPIKNVIVLMEENRSFDHMLGFLKREVPELDGLTGKEYNPNDVKNPKGSRTYVDDKSPYISPYDPDHSFNATIFKIFGSFEPGKVAHMDGFAEYEHKYRKEDPKVVLDMFTPERVPIISTLAKEFAVFDHWFSSVPGPTHPNRLYCHSATSHGSIDNDVPHGGWPQTTIYDHITEANLTWRMYYTDSIWALMLKNLRKAEYKNNFRPIEQFYEDCKTGDLPNYTWLEPQYAPTKTSPAQDQHPDHTVAAGEQIMKKAYEAIRASPAWNSSLFIITYDEHGGFYDHFPTPLEGVPSPDDIENKQFKFNFNRLGIRIPAVLISPWINKGTIVHEPTHGPTTTSQYELSSVPATMKKIFNLKSFLTKRDEWAGTFEWLFTQRNSPRTDCPKVLPPAPTVPEEYLIEEGQKPMNSLQLSYIAFMNDMLGLKGGEDLNQVDGGEYMKKLNQRFFDSL